MYQFCFVVSEDAFTILMQITNMMMMMRMMMMKRRKKKASRCISF